MGDLCAGLVKHGSLVEPNEVIQPENMPARYNQLLVHHDHMTTKLEGYYRRPLELRVLDHERDGDLYHRRILLTLAGTEQVVEFGIVRVNLAFTPDDVRTAILKRKTPLGEILSRHNVLRRINPRWYLRFPSNCPLLS